MSTNSITSATEGIGHNCRLAVARLGRGPASRFGLLAKHRSGIQFPSREARASLEARAGIEPAHNGFADRRVTTSPPGRTLMILPSR